MKLDFTPGGFYYICYDPYITLCRDGVSRVFEETFYGDIVLNVRFKNPKQKGYLKFEVTKHLSRYRVRAEEIDSMVCLTLPSSIALENKAAASRVSDLTKFNIWVACNEVLN